MKLNNVGGVYDDLGDKPKAVAYYEQALQHMRAIGDRGGEGTTLWNLGAYFLNEEKYRISLACLVLAKSLFVKVQSPHASTVQRWIARLRSKVGDEQFNQLLAQVEPRAREIVDEALGQRE